MQIIIKTLQQKQFPLEVQAEDTVQSLKKRIEEIEKMDPIKQMLIFQGFAFMQFRPLI
jgi:Ubiquitin family